MPFPRSSRWLCVTSLALGLGSILAIDASFASASTTAAVANPHATTADGAQVVAQINAIRASFGLPAGHLTHEFDASVLLAATGGADPTLPPLEGPRIAEFGLWGLAPDMPSTSAATTKSVVRAWVFEDGWRGSNTWNLDCTGPGAVGCNGHRRAVLSASPAPGDHLSIDVATLPSIWQGVPSVSLAVLMVWNAGPSTALGG